MDAGAVEGWARQHFGGAALGDGRRTRRLVKVAAALARGGPDAGGTITSVMSQPCQAKAAYRLLDRPELTHEAVLHAHAARTLAATEAPGAYLLIEDTTGLSYPSRPATVGLGPLGQPFTRGLWMHSTLALRVEPDLSGAEVLGLLGQRVWARPAERPRPRKRRPGRGRGKETDHARQLRADRESARWMQALRGAGGPVPGTTWTYVADRESDIYELFQGAWAGGWSYVIRATHRRALAGPDASLDLFTAAARAPVRGEVTLDLPRQGRLAKLEVRSACLELRGPKRPGGRLEDHTLGVVRVDEIGPPRGSEGVCWVLLSDRPASSLNECLAVIAIYRWRWLIEEFHKALKTGLRIEASQLSDARRIGALAGVLSVVATRLIDLKLAARRDPQAPPRVGEADASMLAVLKKLDPPAAGGGGGGPTRRWLYRAIAKLGGFMARKGDGDPGWLTLWRGWQRLMELARGYELARGP